jgi:NTF2-related export protein 1/2
LQKSKHQIESFYYPSTMTPDGKHIPTISWNGNQIDDPSDYRYMIENDMPSRYLHFEVQSFDCHVLNPMYEQPEHPKESSRMMSFVVTVSGYVRFDEAQTGETKTFSENFVLAPRPRDKSATTAKGGIAVRDWLIQNQNFRFV